VKLGAEYRRIWTGSASSNLADGVTFVFLPLLAATITSDPAAIAALSVAYSLPRLLSVLGIGVLVDRLDRRRLLCLANFSRAALFATLTALVIVDAAPMAALYAVYAVMGIVESVSDSAAPAVLPQAVPAAGIASGDGTAVGRRIEELLAEGSGK
jgi:MFS family permease